MALLPAFVGNVEMASAKVDVDIAEHYVDQLVDLSRRHIFDTIRTEHDRTMSEVLAATGQARLLEHQPVLARTLVGPRPLPRPDQPSPGTPARLVARDAGSRAAPPAALLLTINGIAAGLRNTG